MKQLSGIDHMFLQMERGNQYMHVAGLGIYDPSTAPDGKVRFKDILKFFSARIEHLRTSGDDSSRCRSRSIARTGSRTRRSTSNFHVRHNRLAAAGDWRQLCIQVARLHSRPLDRTKPLWEAYVIEGPRKRRGRRRPAALRSTRSCITR
jgi:hypothetical protein